VTASLDAPSHQTPAASPRRTQPGRIRRSGRAAGRSSLYCAALIPLAIGAVIVALSGAARAAAPWWRWLRTRVLGAPSPQATRRPGFFALVGHALLSVLLGTAALMPLGIEVLFVLRGVFYGLVDRGPYNNSWGGPTLAGAWSAHFLVGVPLAAAGLLALIGIAAVHQRLTLALDGGRRAPWLVPVTLVISLAGALFFVAWLHQLPS
jgi:hypothetical protein